MDQQGDKEAFLSRGITDAKSMPGGTGSLDPAHTAVNLQRAELGTVFQGTFPRPQLNPRLLQQERGRFALRKKIQGSGGSADGLVRIKKEMRPSGRHS